jgi:hypothetical protein
MADLVNSTINSSLNTGAESFFDSLGPLGRILATVFTMIGGFVGLYIILLIIKHFEDKKLKRNMAEIVKDLKAMRASLESIEKHLKHSSSRTASAVRKRGSKDEK